MPTGGTHAWQFKTRFRRHAFGWRSQPAISRLQQALSEIKLVGRHDPVLGADGAVCLIERLSPALEHVDSSSGAIGTAVNHAIAELVPLIAEAPADARTRTAWLERSFEAHAADQIPYIEQLGEYWGDLCGSPTVASDWANRLLSITRLALSPDKSTRGFFHGTSACLSALFAAGRFDELVDVVDSDVLWTYKRWAVRALAAQGRGTEAIAYAERCRSPWASDAEIDRRCEQVLLASGRADEAYTRYGLSANRAGTYLAWFRAVAKKYSNRPRATILADLVRHTPGNEGKWFAAAKDAKLFEEAIALAHATPCDPKTLTRAARDFGRSESAFAVEAGLAALRWLVAGHGYEITSLDVRAALTHTLAAATHAGVRDAVESRIRALFDNPTTRSGFVAAVIGKDIGLD